MEYREAQEGIARRLFALKNEVALDDVSWDYASTVVHLNYMNDADKLLNNLFTPKQIEEWKKGGYPAIVRKDQSLPDIVKFIESLRGGMTVPPGLAPYVVEMVTAVAGSASALRQRPPICANFCTIAPLAQDGHSLENALTYAEAGIPMSFMAMPTMGSTAPATPLGALVMGDAEVVIRASASS